MDFNIYSVIKNKPIVFVNTNEMIMLRRKKYVISNLLKQIRDSIVKTRLRLVLFLMDIAIFLNVYFVFNWKFDVDFKVSFVRNHDSQK